MTTRGRTAVRAFARHAAFSACFVALTALHFVALADLPNPAGDEANWTEWGRDLHEGRDVRMPTEASFVSLLFARIIAASYAMFGVDSFAARAPLALASLAASVAAYAVFAARGERRAGVVASLALGVHPWTVAWSRTAAVPYALALACITVGLASFSYGVTHRKNAAAALGVIAIGASAHFSPLGITAALGCAAFAARERVLPWLLTSRAVLAALAVVLASTWSLATQAAHVAWVVAPPVAELEAAAKLTSLVASLASGLSGEATLRHFGGGACSLGTGVAAGLVLFAAVLATRRDESSMGRLGLCVALVALPLVLAPARAWYLPDVDRERYVFALLPWVAFGLGELATRRAGALRTLLAYAAVAWLAFGSLRLGYDARFGGAEDRGTPLLEGGGGYRGFRSTRRGRSAVRAVADDLVVLAPRGSGVILADAALAPLRFECLRRMGTHRGHPPLFFAVAEYGHDPYTYTGDVFFVLYDDTLFAGAARRGRPRALGLELRRRMRDDYEGARLLRRYSQPDGRPLIELWHGRRVERPTPP